jgi:hypothetical protein
MAILRGKVIIILWIGCALSSEQPNDPTGQMNAIFLHSREPKNPWLSGGSVGNPHLGPQKGCPRFHSCSSFSQSLAIAAPVPGTRSLLPSGGLR